jgi:hypothetical protein
MPRSPVWRLCVPPFPRRNYRAELNVGTQQPPSNPNELAHCGRTIHEFYP